ncbi:hypothetical protein K3495_g14861 [Podosphaera aphanis]|nr:hypothetical protein K3495_g14861 [Podosphaera aphanis]
MTGFGNIPTTTANQQGNGLAERIIQPIEAYLRAYVNLAQNNWDEYLDLCEFSWNNSKHVATGLAPFYADQGYLLNSQIIEEQPGDPISSESAALHAKKLFDIMANLKSTIETENERMKLHYDKKHTDIKLHVGDWVMLKTTQIQTKRPCKKLAEKQIEPFKIIKKITNLTYQLDLKNLVGITHDVFHVEKLERATLPQQGQQEYGIEWFVVVTYGLTGHQNSSSLNKFRNGL